MKYDETWLRVGTDPTLPRGAARLRYEVELDVAAPSATPSAAEAATRPADRDHDRPAATPATVGNPT